MDAHSHTRAELRQTPTAALIERLVEVWRLGRDVFPNDELPPVDEQDPEDAARVWESLSPRQKAILNFVTMIHEELGARRAIQ